MKKLLICPSERAGVSLLARSAPLAAVPFMGQSLVEYWLSSLSASGVTEVLVLAHDRPEQIRAVAGDGARWGLKATVIEESRELTEAQAMIKYAQQLEAVPSPEAISVLDHFPGQPEQPLFGNYSGLFAGLRAWLPKALTADRVGFREVSPAVWVSTCARVSPEAVLKGPCWIGRYVSIGAGAVIGAGSVVEDGVMIEPGAEVANSCIGAATFVGSLARLENSFALGSTLVNWQNGSVLEIPDPFLLCALSHGREAVTARWFAKISELIARAKEEPALAWKNLLLNKEG